MKNFLGLVALALVLALSPSATAKGFYVTTLGGGNWSGVDIEDVSTETGYVIGAAVGSTIDSVPGLRLESELAYRSNKLVFCELPITDSTWSAMANAVYDFPVKVGGLHPYALAGLGYAQRTAALDNIPGYELSNGGFAWQVGAGVNTSVADNVVLGVGYRYMNAPDLGVGSIHDGGDNHSAIASVSFAFN